MSGDTSRTRHRKRRGGAIVWIGGLCAVTALALGAFVYRYALRERWHIWRYESYSRPERNAALDFIREHGSGQSIDLVLRALREQTTAQAAFKAAEALPARLEPREHVALAAGALGLLREKIEANEPFSFEPFSRSRESLGAAYRDRQVRGARIPLGPLGWRGREHLPEPAHSGLHRAAGATRCSVSGRLHKRSPG